MNATQCTLQMTQCDSLSDETRSEIQKNLNTLAYEFCYKRKKMNLPAILRHMAFEHMRLGADDYYTYHDINAFKQHCYVATKLIHLSFDYERRQDDKSLVYTLLSDNAEVLAHWTDLATDKFVEMRDNPRNSEFYMHMRQLAMQDRYAEIETKLEVANNDPQKSVKKDFAKRINFFTCFLERDKKGLEAQILYDAKIWQRRLKRGQVHFAIATREFLAANAMVHARLCWLKGIEVEIDHPLVPLDLLAIKPLDHYDDVYDFLAPDWVPPPQNIIERVSRWWEGN